MTIIEQELSGHVCAPQHEIAVAASQVLANSSVAELRRLQVDERSDQLQLTGQVRSFYHKQLAQETVRTVACGMQVVNRICVCN